MKRKKKIFIAVGITSVMLALLVFIQSRDEINPPITLPDGSTLHFRGATVRTNLVYRSPLANITQFLPVNIEAKLEKKFPEYIQTGSRTVTFSGGTIILRGMAPRLVVWLDSKGLTKMIPISLIGSAPSSTVMIKGIYVESLVINEGQRIPYPSNMSFGGLLMTDKPSPLVIGSPAENVAVVECVFYEKNDEDELIEIGRFRFKNPAYDKSKK